MLIQEFRLWNLWVRVYHRALAGRETIRVVVIRGSSGGVALIELPAGGEPWERERLTDLVASAAIREICAELDRKEGKE